MVDLSGRWLKYEDAELVKSVHEAVVLEFGRRALQYTDTAGAPEPRRELQQILARVGFPRHEVLFTVSLADSLRAVATVHLNPGECLDVEDPTQREALVYTGCGSPKAVYIQPYWRNPDGYVYSVEELKAVESSAPFVIFDLTYGLLSAEVSTTAKASVVVVGSLDVLFPGLHLGFIAVPEWLFPTYLSLLEAAYLHPPTYMQYLFYVALKTGAVDKVFYSLKRRGALIRRHCPATPYFAWCRPRDKSIFLRHGAVEGSVFSRRGRFDGYVRLGLTSATEEELDGFLSKLPPEELQGGGDS
jgi:Transcriptional regulators containing a DNA-binding HTH domain and an aminotransferase domain (MocR family) and their eukaryotic orthologs